jgi:hypothetical protein
MKSKKASRKRPIETYFLWLLLVFLSLNGLVAGSLMLIATDGSLLKMDPTWLDKSPFSSFLLPGCLLFLLIGVLPMLALTGLIFDPQWRWARFLNIYPTRRWGWTFSLYSGIGTIIWIIVQQFMTGFFFLQPIILSLGLSLVILTLMPRVMNSNIVTNG